MAEDATIAITGRTKAACSERLAATHHIMGGDGTSQRMWMIKIFTAIAVARICAPTELMTAAFRGAVLNRRKNAATAIAGTITLPFANRATIMKGTPSNILAA